jgi:hypothetical protein
MSISATIPSMLPHFINLLSRTWADVLAAFGTTTLAAVVVPAIIWLSTIVRKWRSGRSAMPPVTFADAFSHSAKSAITTAGITIVVWMLIFSYFGVRAIYRDHESLVAKASAPKPPCPACPAAKPALAAKLGTHLIGSAGPAGRDTLVTIIGGIVNNGAPSIPDDFWIDAQLGDKKIHGFIVRGVNTVINRHPTKSTTVLSGEDYWLRACRKQPIPTGGSCEGWIMGEFRGVRMDEFLKNSATITLTLSDVTGQKSSLVIPYSSTPVAQSIPWGDILDEEELARKKHAKTRDKIK